MIASLGYAAAYALLGVVLLVVGFASLDTSTPGGAAQLDGALRQRRHHPRDGVSRAGHHRVHRDLDERRGGVRLGVSLRHRLRPPERLAAAASFVLIDLATPGKFGEVSARCRSTRPPS